MTPIWHASNIVSSHMSGKKTHAPGKDETLLGKEDVTSCDIFVAAISLWLIQIVAFLVEMVGYILRASLAALLRRDSGCIDGGARASSYAVGATQVGHEA